MFLKSDRLHINGDLDKLKADVIRVETKLDEHQRHFEKHERRDDERFHMLTTDVKQFNVENTKQHEQIKTLINRNITKLAWIAGFGVSFWLVIQLFLSGIIKVGGVL